MGKHIRNFLGYLLIFSLVGCGKQRTLSDRAPLSSVEEDKIQAFGTSIQKTVSDSGTGAPEGKGAQSFSTKSLGNHESFKGYSRFFDLPGQLEENGNLGFDANGGETAGCPASAVPGAPQFPLRTNSYANLFQINNARLCQYQFYDGSRALDISNAGYFQNGLVVGNVQMFHDLLGGARLRQTVVADFRQTKHTQTTHISVVTQSNHVMVITWFSNGSVRWGVEDLHETVYPVTADAVLNSGYKPFHFIQVRGVDNGNYRYHRSIDGKWHIN